MDLLNWSHTTLKDVNKLFEIGNRDKALELLMEHENQLARAYKALALVHGEMTEIGQKMKNMDEKLRASNEENKVVDLSFKDKVEEYEKLATKIGNDLKQIKVHIKLSE